MKSPESALMDFVRARADEDEDVTLHPDTDLFESGLLDSMGAIAMITLVEEMTGRQIDMETLKPEQLRTVRQIVERFFADPVAEVRSA